MPHRLLPIAAVVAGALAAPAGASAATFKVVSATHSSSSTKSVEGYQGTSTASWKLAEATSKAPNRITVNRVGTTLTGIGAMNLRGSYSVDIATTWPGRCAWTAPTGDREHPIVAPGRSDLAVGPDPRNPKRLLVGFMAVHASLANAYLGTECSTSVSGEPDVDDVATKAVSPSLFRRRTIKLTLSGTRTADDITYTWATRITLKRIKR
jgi:hypothetical protein